MRRVCILALALAALALLRSQPAAAQDYPWCLVNVDKIGAVTCAFVTREQCQMSTGGNVGFCMQNPGYVPAVAPPNQARRRARTQ